MDLYATRRRRRKMEIHMRSSRPTLKDVAERSGYALRTVKKVLSGDTSVREKTRLSVMAAAEELHYTRNRAASALARNRTIRFAVLYSVTSQAYFPEVKRGFDMALKDFQDFGLVLENHSLQGGEWQNQAAVLDALLERDDIDGVIMQPINSIRLNPQINALAERGIPVVTFGSDAPESRRLFYVGPDACKSGRIGAQILANYIGKQGRVCLVNQDLDHMQTRERCRGFTDRVQEHYPGMRVFERNLPRNDQLYYEHVCRLLQEEELNGIFCTDANTLIAARALHDLNKRDVVLIGFDMSPAGARLMHEGYLRVVIEQKPENISHLATTLLYHCVADGVVPTTFNRTPLYILTSECLEED